MTDWPFADPRNVAVVTTRSITRGGAWIAHVFHDADDGCWQFHDADPAPADEKDGILVALDSMVARDPSLAELADLPLGWRAWREAPGAAWQRAPHG